MIDLSSLIPSIRDLPAVQAARASRELPLISAARVPVVAALAGDSSGPVLFLSPRADRVLTIAQELPYWAPNSEVTIFPEPDPLFYEQLPWGERTKLERARVLAMLELNRFPAGSIIVASARGIMARTLAPEQLADCSRTLRAQETLEITRLLHFLVEIGYETASIVTSPGQFSRRGGIIDIWPAIQNAPVRIELFGNEIESIREFDPASQRSNRVASEAWLSPAREGVPRLLAGAPEHPPELHEFYLPWTPHGLLDYLPSDTVVLLDDQSGIEAAVNELESQALELRQQLELERRSTDVSPRPYLTIDELLDSLDRLSAIDLGLAADENPPAFAPGPRFGGQVKPLLDHLGKRRMAHESCIIVSRQASRLVDLWSQAQGPRHLTETLPQELPPGEIYFLQGALTEGWQLEQGDRSRLQLLTDAEIFGWARPQLRRRVRPRVTAPESAYSDLKPGVHVVHVDYGIGTFDGLVSRTLEDLEREYLLLSYAEGDQLYVPIHQADRITRYLGVDGGTPKLSRLGSQRWGRTRKEARAAVEQMAEELLELYAKRMTVVGHSFAKDTPWQRELEASFPYVETDDQIRALQAIKADMERSRPMDRLICGDVGYGKTEVALRAAFKAVMDGRQVGLLVPTTVLAQQHYRTFRRRLAAFPIEVEMLSRFRTRAETADIVERISSGQTDIVIGTHRLLQKDVVFKDLGLLIIDEEQRFGVTHKEYLKSMRTEVDVLTLTATPIPRTLYQALTGVRDISTIDTAPEDRLPVVTHSGPYDPALVRQAVLRELDRGGQAFFVHNRVHSIGSVLRRLQRLIPEARIEVGHGQMPEKQLAEIMSKFNAGEVDVLLSTSIIESGLDIPNANTLIVDRADRFGLAQLYQLRGRVGRASVRAYAYFFHPSGYRATPEALERLEIIGENSQLGAGYSIALRDLEMRGAGDLLGKRQHGRIAAIGFHFYTQLLGEAVRRLRDQRRNVDVPEIPVGKLPVRVSIELPLSSALTTAYVPDRKLRLQLYRRMASLRTPEEVESIESELSDRFGPAPPEVENLLYQLQVKVLASEVAITSLTSEAGQILIRFAPGQQPDDPYSLGDDIRVSKRGLWLTSLDWKNRLLMVLRDLNAELVSKIVVADRRRSIFES